MTFSIDSLNRLRYEIKGRISDKRFKHTLGVEKMAKKLGEILLPDKVSELCAAALLHDVAKELTYDEHVSLLETSNVKYTQEDLRIKPALHSLAGAPLICRDYPEFATENVLSAVMNHTLGAPHMSVFDEIIFISDYAEEGRTYPVCIDVHNMLMTRLSTDKTFEDNLTILHKASLKAIESTISALSFRGEKINSKTLLTKKYLEEIL